MALVFRQTITTNANEVFALYSAIRFHLLKPLKVTTKVSISEYLAIEPLKKVGSRLHAKYLNESVNHKARQFSFNLAPQEVLAIMLCIKNKQDDLVLRVILGKIHQRSLNLEEVVELNFNPQKQ